MSSHFQKVMILGSGGAGKSTLAKKLGERLNLPVYHLDAIFWQPNWVEPVQENWLEAHDELCKRETWIIDGNYGSVMEQRFSAADTIVFLDFPAWLCILRALKRRLIFNGRTRPDMAQNCPEKIDLEFLQWIWTYPRTRRPKILQTIEKLKSTKNTFVLRSPREVSEFIKQLN
jgi:adenylate kinase family enzyme